ncbi:alpha/beta hydrolase [Flammeovirga kamogawensis]|uniref:Esterase n=2 Tax=Flammeovirga kamogawensis TaxID=373891 RepID=A0ABX8H0I9_9BACT|nr:alpha/beta hydrolase-fold protein [Flammeovirga kamogawensis]QWG09199.1 esterase [Flammeovirga kamogawensis]TRX70118.1 alpha/beta hydrolase [Flammeovirga kamogawensis]
MKNLLLSFFLIGTIISCSSTKKEKPTKEVGTASDNIMPKVASGKIERIDNFKSKFIDSRLIDVWLPNNYSSDKKYSVLYMHDGLMLFDSTISWNKQEWMVDENVSNLLAKGKIQECIVVAIPNNGKYRSSEYLPQKSLDGLSSKLLDKVIKERLAGKTLADNYLKFLTQELKPYIDNKYSTLTSRENTFVMGSSMGGLISLYAICEYPDVFGGAGCLSTHWPMVYAEKFTLEENKQITDGIIAYTRTNLPNPNTHKIYFDYGTETLDSQYEPYQLRIDKVMKEKGYTSSNWETKKFVGENHSEKSWSKRLAIPLEFLMGTN